MSVEPGASPDPLRPDSPPPQSFETGAGSSEPAETPETGTPETGTPETSGPETSGPQAETTGGKGEFTPHPADKKSFFDKRLNDRPERFEDFIAWQEARRFVNRVYEITEGSEFASSPGIRTEIRTAAIATMSHLAAAVESGGDRDFSRGLNQAASFAAMVRSLMYVVIDQKQLPETEAHELIGRAASLKRMIMSQIVRLKRADTRDVKRKAGRPGGGGFGKKPGGGYGKSGGGFGKKNYGGDRPNRPKRDG